MMSSLPAEMVRGRLSDWESPRHQTTSVPPTAPEPVADHVYEIDTAIHTCTTPSPNYCLPLTILFLTQSLQQGPE